MALYVATASDGTVLFGMRGAIAVSTDQGASWTQTVPLQGAARDYKVAVDLAGNWYAGAYQTGVFRSTDRGASWESIEAGLPNNVVYSVSVPAGGAVYVGLNNATYRSSDTGNTWEEVSDLFGMNTFSVQHAGGNVLIATTTQGNWISTDFGLNWSHGSFASYPSSVFVFARRNGTVLYSTAGRVLRSTDRGATFAISDSGLYLQKISFITQIDSTFFLANEDGGLYRSTDDGENWVFCTATPWGTTVTNLAAGFYSKAIYVLYESGELLRSLDSGATWTQIDNPPVGGPLLSICSTEWDLLAVSIDGHIFAYSDTSGTWDTRGALPTSGGDFSAITLAGDRRHGPMLIAGTDRGMYRSSDAGRTWEQLLVDGLPRWITEVVIDPRGPQFYNQAYCTTSNELYKSTDGGDTWAPTQIDITTPRQLTYNQDADFYLLDSESIRLYPRYSRVLGQRDWRVFPPLPYSGASALAFVTSHASTQHYGKLLVGTESRGMFRSVQWTLDSPSAVAVSDGFSITSLYPLPLSAGSETLHLGLDMSHSGTVTVEIRDLLGRVLRREERGTLTAGSHAISLRATGLPSSMLLLHVHGPGGTRTRMLPTLSGQR
jgi:photosystem II stability/assembly factor-like uncharacterized protein